MNLEQAKRKNDAAISDLLSKAMGIKVKVDSSALSLETIAIIEQSKVVTLRDRITEACQYLRDNAPGRALEALEDALKETKG